jgi:hypothetical protein
VIVGVLLSVFVVVAVEEPEPPEELLEFPPFERVDCEFDEVVVEDGGVVDDDGDDGVGDGGGDEEQGF